MESTTHLRNYYKNYKENIKLYKITLYIIYNKDIEGNFVLMKSDIPILIISAKNQDKDKINLPISLLVESMHKFAMGEN